MNGAITKCDNKWQSDNKQQNEVANWHIQTGTESNKNIK